MVRQAKCCQADTNAHPSGLSRLRTQYWHDTDPVIFLQYALDVAQACRTRASPKASTGTCARPKLGPVLETLEYLKHATTSLTVSRVCQAFPVWMKGREVQRSIARNLLLYLCLVPLTPVSETHLEIPLLLLRIELAVAHWIAAAHCIRFASRY